MNDQLQACVTHAVELFHHGHNCSQAVCGAFAKMYGYDTEQALRISASFGGGIGRMRQTCGAACGLFMVAGMYNGPADPSDRAAKGHNYALVQQLAREFELRNGSLICSELLGLAKNVEHSDTNPQQRDKAYYAKRPCVKMVESAAQIWVDYLDQSRDPQAQ